MTKDQIVTLAKFNSIEEAHIAKSLLNSIGIKAEIANETVAQILPHIEREVRVLINSFDYERAREMLDAKFDEVDFMLIREK